MYLKAEFYIPTYDESLSEFKQNVAKPLQDLLKIVNIDVQEIIVNCGYWRKADQIHDWFVKNVQDGNDNCEKYEVSIEQLIELKSLCEKILKNRDLDFIYANLPPTSAFFFGSNDIDGYYFEDLTDTIEIVNKCIELNDANNNDVLCLSFTYRSSW